MFMFIIDKNENLQKLAELKKELDEFKDKAETIIMTEGAEALDRLMEEQTKKAQEYKKLKEKIIAELPKIAKEVGMSYEEVAAFLADIFDDKDFSVKRIPGDELQGQEIQEANTIRSVSEQAW